MSAQIDRFLSWSPLISVWIASLSGSIHCTGMCGVLYLKVTESSRKNSIIYHLARGSAYVALGACFGGFSQALFFEFAYGFLKVLLNIGFGLYVLWLGVEILYFGRSFSIKTVYRWLGFERFSQKILKQQQRGQGSLKSALVGVMTAFLPCGWLLSFLGIALASRDAGKGALIMVAFWLGTVPWMEALRLGRLNFIHVKLSKYKNYLLIRNAVAIILVANGVYLMARHASFDLPSGGPQKQNLSCGPKER